MSLNISRLPPQIAYDPTPEGHHKVLELGDKFSIRICNPTENEWEEVGVIELNERRRGFWHDMLPKKELSSYTSIGVFADEGKGNAKPWTDIKGFPEYLKSTDCPVLWGRFWEKSSEEIIMHDNDLNKPTTACS